MVASVLFGLAEIGMGISPGAAGRGIAVAKAQGSITGGSRDDESPTSAGAATPRQRGLTVLEIATALGE